MQTKPCDINFDEGLTAIIKVQENKTTIELYKIILKHTHTHTLSETQAKTQTLPDI